MSELNADGIVSKVVVKMNIIKKKRKELGISQKEMGEKLGTSQQTVSSIEKTEIENIPCSLLLKLANIFQIPIDVLIYGEESSDFNDQGEELWEIYKQLDEINKTTLLLIGRRLNDTQVEKMLKKQVREQSDKNSNM